MQILGKTGVLFTGLSGRLNFWDGGARKKIYIVCVL
jgi:hypothetical protein